MYNRVLLRCAVNPNELTWALRETLVDNNIKWLVQTAATSPEFQQKFIQVTEALFVSFLSVLFFGFIDPKTLKI